MSNVTIVALAEARFPDAFALRLRALRDHPEAFGQAYADAVNLTDEERIREWTTFWNHRDNRVFVAMADDGSLVGMVGIARQYRDKTLHRGDIWGVYVTPQQRGHGVGRRLLEAAIRSAREHLKLLQLHLQVISTNQAAVRSYEQAGFVRYGRIPRADIIDGVAYDSDLMVLMLDGHPVAQDPA